VLHLQCHIGRDTLCLARRGRDCYRAGFSSAALDVARRLSAETGLKAEFVQGTVDQALILRPARSIWSLRPGHHLLAARCEEMGGGHCVRAAAWRGALLRGRASGVQCAGRSRRTVGADYDFQTPADMPLHFANETTYTGDPTIMSHRSTREWIHSLSQCSAG